MVYGKIVMKFEDRSPYPVKGHLNSRLECSHAIKGLFKGMRLIEIRDKTYVLEFNHYDLVDMAKDLEFVKKYCAERNSHIQKIEIITI